MRALFLFFKKIYFRLRYGNRFYTIGNTKIGKNFSLIFENPDCKVVLGSNVHIGNNVVFHCDGKEILIGDNTYIDHNVVIRLWGGKVIIGDRVYINSFCVLNGHSSLTIGNDVLIGMQVAIIPSNHVYKNKSLAINLQGIEDLPIIINDNVWIGSGAKILSGVEIGQGSIIGSNAVVNKKITDHKIAVGVPARIIKTR